MVRSIKGLEQAHITRPGYAIEYDFFSPHGLHHWLETKYISGLFFAGQINGTTGYEEAAAQGLLAGLNAALRVKEQEPWVPTRDQAYIGVLVDDLITCGVSEPYRMFTSRAEYRLQLREDNADLRLTEQAYKFGLIDEYRWCRFNEKRLAIDAEKEYLESVKFTAANDELAKILSQPLKKETSLLQLLQRPEVNYKELGKLSLFKDRKIDPKVAEQVEIQTKYMGYVRHQKAEIESNMVYRKTLLPIDLDYTEVIGLSSEAKEKLALHRPANLDQASRIQGITPATISLLRIHLKKRVGTQQTYKLKAHN